MRRLVLSPSGPNTAQWITRSFCTPSHFVITLSKPPGACARYFRRGSSLNTLDAPNSW